MQQRSKNVYLTSRPFTCSQNNSAPGDHGLVTRTPGNNCALWKYHRQIFWFHFQSSHFWKCSFSSRTNLHRKGLRSSFGDGGGGTWYNKVFYYEITAQFCSSSRGSGVCRINIHCARVVLIVGASSWQPDKRVTRCGALRPPDSWSGAGDTGGWALSAPVPVSEQI